MTIKEVKLLKEHGEELEIKEKKLVPIVIYLLQGDHLFMSINDICKELNTSRYFVKRSMKLINEFIEEKKKLEKN